MQCNKTRTPIAKGSIRSRQSRQVGNSSRYESSPGVDRNTREATARGDKAEGRPPALRLPTFHRGLMMPSLVLVRRLPPLTAAAAPSPSSSSAAAPTLVSPSPSSSSSSASARSSRSDSELSSARASCEGPNAKQLADDSRVSPSSVSQHTGCVDEFCQYSTLECTFSF